MKIFNFYLYRISRNWIMFLLVLCLPVVHIYTTYQQYQSNFQYRIGVVDQSKDELSKLLIEQLSKNNVLVEQTSGIKELEDKLIKNEVQYAIVIEQGLQQDVMDNMSYAKIRGFSLTDDGTSIPLKLKLNSFLSATKTIAGISFEDINDFSAALERLKQSSFTIAEQYEGNKAKDTYVGLVNVLAFDIFFLLVSISLIFLKDKERGIYERILVSPVASIVYYIQSTILFVLIGMVQFFIGHGFINFLIGTKITAPHFLHINIGIILYVACLAIIGQIIVAVSKNSKIGFSLLPVVVLPLGMLSGQLWPREIMPTILQQISSFFPTSWIVMFNKSEVLFGLSSGEFLKYSAYFTTFLCLGILLVYLVVKKDGVKNV
ncbi:ABC-type multidrug transport system, permease component [Fontibacillus panacisegetis]|uniref:ABC-type multidrug transport system, permease component n=1 Tax=Fontibacillus panacisegetis TaxID=670482 RepID=A0A1G7I751_9BACL|nr:ABC transporter permease [Fontibacillus panacisegetis]SDF08551.1 ABC-type multidrug transport system, permease component [Fontibacillus panacisegetis]